MNVVHVLITDISADMAVIMFTFDLSTAQGWPTILLLRQHATAPAPGSFTLSQTITLWLQADEDTNRDGKNIINTQADTHKNRTSPTLPAISYTTHFVAVRNTIMSKH